MGVASYAFTNEVLRRMGGAETNMGDGGVQPSSGAGTGGQRGARAFGGGIFLQFPPERKEKGPMVA
jgi:hypothetical protein